MTHGVQQVLHYPRLDTVMMVEEVLKKAGTYPTKAELLRALPKSMMYQTFLLILDYLEDSGKVYIDKKDGRIVWIWDPQGVRSILKAGLVIR